MQKFLSRLRQGIEKYNLIEDGDKIIVGVSGGKDSIVLAVALKHLQRFFPKRFELLAVSLDMNGGKTDFSEIENYFKEINLDYKIIKTNIWEVVFNERKEKNPCSLCSKMRRGALANTAQELGYNKIALGHHADDLIETFFLSMFYEGRLSTFAPQTLLSRTNITQIRPMVLIEEKNISALFKKQKMPLVKAVCPVDKETKRAFVKEKINELKKEIPFIKERILGAITSPERYNLFKDCNIKKK